METKTSNFLLPLLGKELDFYTPYLVDSYLTLENEKPKNHIINVVFTWKAKPGYDKFLEKLQAFDSYRGEFELANGEFKVFLFEIPDEFKTDYAMFLLGKYSLMSKEAKVLLLKGRKPDSSMSDILNKGKKLREYWEKKLAMVIPSYNELYSIYKIEEETLYKEKFQPSKPKNEIVPSEEFN